MRTTRFPHPFIDPPQGRSAIIPAKDLGNIMIAKPEGDETIIPMRSEQQQLGSKVGTTQAISLLHDEESEALHAPRENFY